MGILDKKEEIRACIDAYEWKHSWHLPKDEWGYIKWYNKETLEKCYKILQDYALKAAQFSAKCQELNKLIRETLSKWDD